MFVTVGHCARQQALKDLPVISRTARGAFRVTRSTPVGLLSPEGCRNSDPSLSISNVCIYLPKGRAFSRLRSL